MSKELIKKKNVYKIYEKKQILMTVILLGIYIEEFLITIRFFLKLLITFT